MPIKIPNSLPARATLEGENIFVMTEYRAIHQDIRPLKLCALWNGETYTAAPLAISLNGQSGTVIIKS